MAGLPPSVMMPDSPSITFCEVSEPTPTRVDVFPTLVSADAGPPKAMASKLNPPAAMTMLLRSFTCESFPGFFRGCAAGGRLTQLGLEGRGPAPLGRDFLLSRFRGARAFREQVPE